MADLFRRKQRRILAELDKKQFKQKFRNRCNELKRQKLLGEKEQKETKKTHSFKGPCLPRNSMTSKIRMVALKRA